MPTPSADCSDHPLPQQGSTPPPFHQYVALQIPLDSALPTHGRKNSIRNIILHHSGLTKRWDFETSVVHMSLATVPGSRHTHTPSRTPQPPGKWLLASSIVVTHSGEGRPTESSRGRFSLAGAQAHGPSIVSV